jgi:hypothetical protein
VFCGALLGRPTPEGSTLEMMNELAIGIVTFACSFGAALVGMALHKRLPDAHLDSESKDVLKLVMGLIGTMSALVLGLLIASAQSAYNSQSGRLQHIAADIIQLDHMLASYGPEAKDTRDLLREAVRTAHDRLWSSDGVRTEKLDPLMRLQGERFMAHLQGLTPRNDAQRFLQSQALQLSETIGQARSLMFEQARSSVSWPFLTILLFWISMLFLGFGLLVRFHATVAIAALIGSLSVAAAIFLILDLGSPYAGLIQLSDLPLRDALAQIDQGTP